MAYGLGVSSVAAVGVVVYAHHSPEFRSTMEAKIPRFGFFVDSVNARWKRVVEIGTAKWGDLKNMVNPGKSEKIDLPVQQVAKPDKVVATISLPGEEKAEPTIITDSVEKDAKKEEGSTVATDSSAAMDTTATETTKQSEEISSSLFVEQKEEAAASKDSSQFVKSSEQISVDTQQQKPAPQATEQPVTQVADANMVEGSDITPKGEEIHGLPDEDKISKDSFSSLSETDRRAAAENELRQVFQDYVMNSDFVIASLTQLAHALSAHHQQVLQATGTPEEEIKTEDVAGKM